MTGRALLALAVVAAVLYFALARGGQAPRAPAPEAILPPEVEPDAVAEEPGAILLHVVDSGDDSPVTGVDLALRGDDRMLDVAFEERNRAWVAAGLAPGTYVVSVGAERYGPVTLEIPVPAGTEVPVRVRLLKNPAVHGFVTDRSGAPLGGILVAFGYDGGRVRHATYTSRNGAFHISLPRHDGPDWGAELSFDDPGKVYASTRSRPGDPTGEVHRVVLPRATRVVGRLTPRPADVGRLHYEGDDFSTAENLPLGPDGSFAVTDLPAGQDLRATIVVVGHAPVVRGPFRLEPEERLDLGDLEVGPGRSLVFAVRGTTGDAALDLRVSILLPGLFDVRVVECESHVARVDLLPDGPILLHVEAKGMGGRWIRIDKVAEFTRKEVVLEPAGTIEALVLDADGRPAAGIVICRVEDRPTFQDDVYTTTTVNLPPTDAQGRVRAEVAEGGHLLRVEGAEESAVETRSGRTTPVEIRLRKE